MTSPLSITVTPANSPLAVDLSTNSVIAVSVGPAAPLAVNLQNGAPRGERGPVPNHEFNGDGTSIRWELPSGEWGEWLEISVAAVESDPVFIASQAYGITADDIAAWNAGNYPAEEFASSWGDVASRKIYTTEADKRIYAVTVIVTEAYNGVGAAVTIGDSGDVDRLFPASAIDLTTIGTYEYHPAHLYASAVDINVYNTAGAGASSGSCQIIIQHQK